MPFLFGCTPHVQQEELSPYVVFLVDAPHLDCSNNRALCKTIAKHPSNGNKSGDVGHAWIYLHGWNDGNEITVEGGHSGETGIEQAKYFEGIMNYVRFGYANPPECFSQPRFEPNPIKYLWEGQKDGFFQKGAGKHRPTYAAKVFLTDEEFRHILAYIDPRRYNYRDYSLTSHQCTTFVVEVASLAGLQLDCEMEIPIGQTVRADGECFVLWRDPEYSTFRFASPDVLEKSLKRAVKEGRAEPALLWYRRHTAPSMQERIGHACETLIRFPERMYRYLVF